MRIYEIKLLGQQNADGVPRCLVSVLRPFDCNTLTVHIIDPKGEREQHVPVNGPYDIQAMAKHLQYELDGCKGTRSQIRKYCHLLNLFFEDAG
jgi:hypothetical protein